ncbi:hypothetical protein [Streptomyces sp. NPDC058280]|uniref:hypothetical protein n=1 Tax=Streptomyces sp. NPDC058280 TaxID=3346419 RepID=UPI0036EB0DE5
MPFPDSPLDIRTELQLAGVWTDISGYVYTREPITIVQGRADEGTRTDPGRCNLTLNNRDGRFSPRNPRSPYFGVLGRNTPIRVSVPGPESYLALDGTAAATASTPHVTALGITGDLDVRVEVTADWYASRVQNLIGKWDSAASQRSWLLQLDSSALYLRYSADGATSLGAARPLPALPPRAVLRATLDVDNGAGGHVVTFWWGTSTAGPWTPLGDPVVIAGTTAIFNSTAPLLIAPTSTTIVPNWLPMAGRVHRAEVRSGIGGTVAASPDFRALAPGLTGFTDGAGRAWTVNAPGEINNRDYRFTGEATSWPPRWDVSGKDIWTPIEAAGILRRFGQGRKALSSALARRVPGAASVLAYWPLEEEGSTTGRAYSPVPRVPPLSLNGVTWASADTLPSSSALPVLNSSNGTVLPTMYGSVPAPAGSTTGWRVQWIYRLDTANTTLYTYMRLLTTGTVAEWFIQSRDNASRVLARDADGFTVFDQAIGTGSDLFGQWNTVNLHTSEAGGTVTWRIDWQDIGGDAGGFTGTYTGTAGRVRGVASPPDGYAAALDGMAIGHIAVFSTTTTDAYNGAITGYAAETAVSRLVRLAAEEPALPLRVIDGDSTTDSERMGPQRPITLLELLQECADTDGGILYERRDGLGLVYRDRTSLYGQAPVTVLDYATQGEVAPPLEPVEDDQRLRNDVTVTRSGGGSGHAVIDEGPLSILPPELGGVGVYDEALTLSLAVDDQAEPIAYWKAHLGTWDEARFPTIHVQVHTAPRLAPLLADLRIGDLVRITNPPAWLPPEPIDVLIYGYSETLDQFTWDIVMNAAPAGPWRVGVLEDPVFSRIDTDGSRITAAATNTDSALEVHTDLTRGPVWIESAASPADFPFDIRFGGEVATVSSITTRRDQFTRTVANAWGTATSGQVWTQAGGLATDRAVDGARGTINLPTAVSSIRFQQLIDASVGDCEVRVRLSASAVATGASMIPAILLRCLDTATFYRARVHFGTGGTMAVSITRDVTQIGASPTLPYTYAPGDEFEVRVRLTGHTMQLRVWPVGTSEPGVWHHTETVITNPIAAGTIGLTCSAFAGLTNINPQLRYDAFEVVTPQLATLTRSVNGIVKPHSIGTDVRLAVPTITAL